MIKRLFTVVAFLCATTVSLTAQTINPDWHIRNDYHFKAVDKNTESNLTMTVMGTIDGERCDSAFEIGVFCNDECRVAKQFFSQKNYFDRFYFFSKLTINGSSGEKISFRLYDHRNNVEVMAKVVPQEISFKSDAVYGSFNTGLYELAFTGSTTHRMDLVLDDDTDLPFSGKQYSITADGIACSYTRNAYLDGGYETIVLPFDADITEIKEAGFVFEKFEGFGDNTIKFVELADDENLKAGIPYLFHYTGEPNDGRMEIEFTANVQQATGDVSKQEGWTGTFKHMDGNAIAGKYILNIKGDKMQKAGSGASLAPYHCYLELPTGTDVSKFSVSHREYTTGVKNIKEQNYSEEIFDLHGRKLNYMPNCGIIIKNNKKIYIK
ncbi:MAG: hypothetical protein J6V23_00145 [Bacteroidaceae bacterium]|nr:hypothetical protein [Bacteroidaceae bacterium]